MLPCEDKLSELPVTFPSLDVEEAVEILEVNHIVDSTFYFECKRKHEELSRWIKNE